MSGHIKAPDPSIAFCKRVDDLGVLKGIIVLSIQVQQELISVAQRYAYVLLSKSCQTID